jgi:hypothetical protein
MCNTWRHNPAAPYDTHRRGAPYSTGRRDPAAALYMIPYRSPQPVGFIFPGHPTHPEPVLRWAASRHASVRRSPRAGADAGRVALLHVGFAGRQRLGADGRERDRAACPLCAGPLVISTREREWRVCAGARVAPRLTPRRCVRPSRLTGRACGFAYRCARVT